MGDEGRRSDVETLGMLISRRAASRGFPALSPNPRSLYRVRLNQIAPIVRTTASTVNVIPNALPSLLRISTSRHTRAPATRAHAREPLGRNCDEPCLRDSGTLVI